MSVEDSTEPLGFPLSRATLERIGVVDRPSGDGLRRGDRVRIDGVRGACLWTGRLGTVEMVRIDASSSHSDPSVFVLVHLDLDDDMPEWAKEISREYDCVGRGGELYVPVVCGRGVVSLESSRPVLDHPQCFMCSADGGQ
jgi:hypothetical protein